LVGILSTFLKGSKVLGAVSAFATFVTMIHKYHQDLSNKVSEDGIEVVAIVLIEAGHSAHAQKSLIGVPILVVRKERRDDNIVVSVVLSDLEFHPQIGPTTSGVLFAGWMHSSHVPASLDWRPQGSTWYEPF
jgi:hypothetical protein